MQGTTYRGKVTAQLHVRDVGTGEEVQIPRSFGYIPIMVQSVLCHLRDCSRADLINCKEEPDEFGGTFICNGIERIIRLLIQQRRHYIMALKRSAYKKRGPNYTEFATLIRCFAHARVRYRKWLMPTNAPRSRSIRPLMLDPLSSHD